MVSESSSVADFAAYAVQCQWQNLDKEFATCAIPLVSTSDLSAVSPLLASRMPVKPLGIKATTLPPQPIIRGSNTRQSCAATYDVTQNALI